MGSYWSEWIWYYMPRPWKINTSIFLFTNSTRLECYTPPGPGGVLQKNLYGDAQSRVQNFDHLYTSKSVILWPISIPFFCKKHPIWDKLGAFLAKFSKIHPILQIGRIGYLMITHPSIYQNSRKCTSKPFEHPRIPFVSENPPPRGYTITHTRNQRPHATASKLKCIFRGHHTKSLHVWWDTGQ